MQGESLYNNCNANLEGPSAPDLDVELTENSILLTYNNNYLTSNNKNLEYEEIDFFAPINLGFDNTYNFEGYKLYQVASKDFDLSLLNDPSVSRLIAQSDIENGISKIFNWYATTDPFNPLGVPQYNSVQKVNGEDKGIEEIIERRFDAFTNELLIQEETYYYVTIAYAFNNWMNWSNASQIGQDQSYLESTTNVKVTEVVFDITSHSHDFNKSFNFISTSDYFHLKDVSQKSRVILLNTQGQVITSWEIHDGKSLVVNFDDLIVSSGIYFLNVHSLSGSQNESYKVQIIK